MQLLDSLGGGGGGSDRVVDKPVCQPLGAEESIGPVRKKKRSVLPHLRGWGRLSSAGHRLGGPGRGLVSLGRGGAAAAVVFSTGVSFPSGWALGLAWVGVRVAALRVWHGIVVFAGALLGNTAGPLGGDGWRWWLGLPWRCQDGLRDL